MADDENKGLPMRCAVYEGEVWVLAADVSARDRRLAEAMQEGADMGAIVNPADLARFLTETADYIDFHGMGMATTAKEFSEIAAGYTPTTRERAHWTVRHRVAFVVGSAVVSGLGSWLLGDAFIAWLLIIAIAMVIVFVVTMTLDRRHDNEQIAQLEAVARRAQEYGEKLRAELEASQEQTRPPDEEG